MYVVEIEQAYFYIEENLYGNQAKTIYDFMIWLGEINRPYGSANAQDRWKEFKRGDKAPKDYFCNIKQNNESKSKTTEK